MIYCLHRPTQKNIISCKSYDVVIHRFFMLGKGGIIGV